MTLRAVDCKVSRGVL